MTNPTRRRFLQLASLPLLASLSIACQSLDDGAGGDPRAAGGEDLRLSHSSPGRMSGTFQLGEHVVVFDASDEAGVRSLRIQTGDGRPLLTLGTDAAAPADGGLTDAPERPAIARLAGHLEEQGFTRQQYPVLVLIREASDLAVTLGPSPVGQARPGAARPGEGAGLCLEQRCLADESWDETTCSCQPMK